MERLLLVFSHAPEAERPAHSDARDSEKALSLLTSAYPDLQARISNARVLDFGCGWGEQAVAFAKSGASFVVGIDINAQWLEKARRLANENGVAEHTQFKQALDSDDAGRFDVVVSQNSMEHFPDPAAALRVMRNALAANGELLITFAPPWYAPYGSHMHFFTRIPWVHLFFPERAVMAVRSRYKHDGAMHYEDVEGGLNRMSVSKFRRLIRSGGLSVLDFKTEPVKGQRFLSRIPFLQEFFINRVSAVLVRR